MRRSSKKKEEAEVQTILFCTSHLLRAGDVASVQSHQSTQTVVTASPLLLDEAFYSQLQRVDTEDVQKDSIQIIKWRRRLHFMDAEMDNISIVTSQKSGSCEANSEIIPPKEEHAHKETQTRLMVFPHFLRCHENAVVTCDISIQTTVTCEPQCSLSEIVPKLRAYLEHTGGREITAGDNINNRSIVDIIKEILHNVDRTHEHLFDDTESLLEYSDESLLSDIKMVGKKNTGCDPLVKHPKQVVKVVTPEQAVRVTNSEIVKQYIQDTQIEKDPAGKEIACQACEDTVTEYAKCFADCKYPDIKCKFDDPSYFDQCKPCQQHDDNISDINFAQKVDICTNEVLIPNINIETESGSSVAIDQQSDAETTVSQTENGSYVAQVTSKDTTLVQTAEGDDIVIQTETKYMMTCLDQREDKKESSDSPRKYCSENCQQCLCQGLKINVCIKNFGLTSAEDPNKINLNLNLQPGFEKLEVKEIIQQEPEVQEETECPSDCCPSKSGKHNKLEEGDLPGGKKTTCPSIIKRMRKGNSIYFVEDEQIECLCGKKTCTCNRIDFCGKTIVKKKKSSDMLNCRAMSVSNLLNGAIMTLVSRNKDGFDVVINVNNPKLQASQDKKCPCSALEYKCTAPESKSVRINLSPIENSRKCICTSTECKCNEIMSLKSETSFADETKKCPITSAQCKCCTPESKSVRINLSPIEKSRKCKCKETTSLKSKTLFVEETKKCPITLVECKCSIPDCKSAKINLSPTEKARKCTCTSTECKCNDTMSLKSDNSSAEEIKICPLSSLECKCSTSESKSIKINLSSIEKTRKCICTSTECKCNDTKSIKSETSSVENPIETKKCPFTSLECKCSTLESKSVRIHLPPSEKSKKCKCTSTECKCNPETVSPEKITKLEMICPVKSGKKCPCLTPGCKCSSYETKFTKFETFPIVKNTKKYFCSTEGCKCNNLQTKYTKSETFLPRCTTSDSKLTKSKEKQIKKCSCSFTDCKCNTLNKVEKHKCSCSNSGCKCNTVKTKSTQSEPRNSPRKNLKCGCSAPELQSAKTSSSCAELAEKLFPQIILPVTNPNCNCGSLGCACKAGKSPMPCSDFTLRQKERPTESLPKSEEPEVNCIEKVENTCLDECRSVCQTKLPESSKAIIDKNEFPDDTKSNNEYVRSSEESPTYESEKPSVISVNEIVCESNIINLHLSKYSEGTVDPTESGSRISSYLQKPSEETTEQTVLPSTCLDECKGVCQTKLPKSSKEIIDKNEFPDDTKPDNEYVPTSEENQVYESEKPSFISANEVICEPNNINLHLSEYSKETVDLTRSVSLISPRPSKEKVEQTVLSSSSPKKSTPNVKLLAFVKKQLGSKCKKCDPDFPFNVCPVPCKTKAKYSKYEKVPVKNSEDVPEPPLSVTVLDQYPPDSPLPTCVPRQCPADPSLPIKVSGKVMPDPPLPVRVPCQYSSDPPPPTCLPTQYPPNPSLPIKVPRRVFPDPPLPEKVPASFPQDPPKPVRVSSQYSPDPSLPVKVSGKVVPEPLLPRRLPRQYLSDSPKPVKITTPASKLVPKKRSASAARVKAKRKKVSGQEQNPPESSDPSSAPIPSTSTASPSQSMPNFLSRPDDTKIPSAHTMIRLPDNTVLSVRLTLDMMGKEPGAPNNKEPIILQRKNTSDMTSAVESTFTMQSGVLSHRTDKINDNESIVSYEYIKEVNSTKAEFKKTDKNISFKTSELIHIVSDMNKTLLLTSQSAPNINEKFICHPCKSCCKACKKSSYSKMSKQQIENKDVVFMTYKTCEEELKPAFNALTNIKDELRKLNIPEVNCIFKQTDICKELPRTNLLKERMQQLNKNDITPAQLTKIKLVAVESTTQNRAKTKIKLKYINSDQSTRKTQTPQNSRPKFEIRNTPSRPIPANKTTKCQYKNPDFSDSGGSTPKIYSTSKIKIHQKDYSSSSKSSQCHMNSKKPSVCCPKKTYIGSKEYIQSACPHKICHCKSNSSYRTKPKMCIYDSAYCSYPTLSKQSVGESSRSYKNEKAVQSHKYPKAYLTPCASTSEDEQSTCSRVSSRVSSEEFMCPARHKKRGKKRKKSRECSCTSSNVSECPFLEAMKSVLFAGQRKGSKPRNKDRRC